MAGRAGQDHTAGARFLDGIIARSIRPAIAEYVLEKPRRRWAPGDAVVIYGEDGDFAVRAPADGA